MSIAVKCRECGKQYNVKDAAAGKSFDCRECDNKVRVPLPEQKTGQKKQPPVKKKKPTSDPWDDANSWDDDDEEDYAEPQQRRRNSPSKRTTGGKKRKKKKASPLPMILGIGGGVLLFSICLGGFFWLMFGRSPATVDIDSLTEWKRVTIEGQKTSLLMPDVPQIKEAFNEANGGKSYQFFLPLKDDPKKGYFWELSYIPFPEGVKEDSSFAEKQIVRTLESLYKNKNIDLKKKSKIEIGKTKGANIQFIENNKQASIWVFGTKKGTLFATMIEPVGKEKEALRKKFLESIEIDGVKFQSIEEEVSNETKKKT